MKHLSIKLLCVLLFLAIQHNGNAQVIPPLNRSLQLTGNFGELRTNHFHTGLDFRSAIGTPVYSIDEGYVSRVSVSAGGYGNALYITHPTGITSVYAHLNGFISPIAEMVCNYQCEMEYYAVDIKFSPEDFPIKKGEVVAYTGNRGSSGGPHLHFEIRETATENPLDPLNYYSSKIKDTRSPVIREIIIVPKGGVVNDKSEKYKHVVIKQDNRKIVKDKIFCWGDIVVGLKAFDHMDGMNNIYGVHYVDLYMDDELIFSSHVDRLSFEKGRQINAYIDTEEWLKNKSLYMLSYLAKGNTLSFYDENLVRNRGVITINEERGYNFKYVVSDYYGNRDSCTFEIEGRKTSLPDDAKKYIPFDEDYHFSTETFSIKIPAFSTYDDYAIEYSKVDTLYPNSCSVKHTLNPYYQGMDKNCKISIKIDADTISDKSKYYIAQLHSTGKKEGLEKQTYISQYLDGWINTRVKDFGDYVVRADLKKPIIKYHGVVAGELRFTVNDKESGLKYFRGEIDGKFVLFTYDIKDMVARYKIEQNRFSKGTHNLKFEAVDNCGNKKEFRVKLNL